MIRDYSLIIIIIPYDFAFNRNLSFYGSVRHTADDIFLHKDKDKGHGNDGHNGKGR